MHNIEDLRKEKESCRKKVVTLSILAGLSVVLMIVNAIVYGLVLASVLADKNASGATIALISGIYVILMILLAIAICIFIPFIVINGVKHGKRRRLLNKIDNDNGVING